MIYLHETNYSETLIRHWANEVELENDDDYNVATYRIRQIETGNMYNNAIDVIPCRYTYEVCNEKIYIPVKDTNRNEKS